MCDDCLASPAESYNNWLRHHKPGDLLERSQITARDFAIEVLLTLRLEPLNEVEVRNSFPVLTEERAREITLAANKIMENVEDALVESLSNNFNSEPKLK